MFKTLSLIITTALLSIIFTLGALGFYIWKYNPMNMKAYLIAGFFNSMSSEEVLEEETETTSAEENTQTTGSSSANALISSEQADLLQKAGIDVSSLPSTISPELEACFKEKLGEERVEEIKGGDIPGPFELLKAKGCL